MLSAPWTGAVALGVAAVGYALLLAGIRRLERAHPALDPTEASWWFGYSRDAANAAGLLLASGGFLALGFPGPLALLAGFLFALLEYGSDYLFSRPLPSRPLPSHRLLSRRLLSRRPTLVLALLFLCLAGASVAGRAELLSVLDAGLAWLFRRPPGGAASG